MMQNISNLSNFKGFLALHLVALHTFPVSYKNLWIDRFLSLGSISTSIFIILSGFFLAYFYNNKDLSVIPFLKKRIFKLYPLHFCIVLFTSFMLVDQVLRGFYHQGLTGNYLYVFGLKEFLISIFSQLFLIDSLNPFFLGLNVPGWTLSTLVFCWFFFPFLMKITKDFNLYKSTYLILVIVIFFNVLSFILIYLGFSDVEMSRNDGVYTCANFVTGFIHRSPLIRIFEFLIGILIFRIIENKTIKINNVYHICGLLLILLLLVCYFPNDYIVRHNGFYLFFEVVLIFLLLGVDDLRILQFSLLNRISSASFVIYLVHVPLLLFLSRLTKAGFLIIDKLVPGYSLSVLNIGDSMIFFLFYFSFCVFLCVVINEKYLKIFNEFVVVKFRFVAHRLMRK